jgi:N-acetylneuraminic acid mutarotase
MKGTSSKPLLGSAARSVCLMAVVLGLVACHGSGSANSSSYTVGGTITGLTVSSVVLANGTATVTVLAGATTWVFPGSFTANSAYAVTVVTQPVGELCEVTGAGSAATLTGNVSDVIVTCSNTGDWIWEGGVTTVNASGTYGTQGAASASSTPGGRYSASSWTDSSGTFWLFGGAGYDSSGAAGRLNDLWRYTPSTNQWTWISGDDVANAGPVYGLPGTPSATNVPGARYSASSWIDASGNLWLFGGFGYDATGAVGNMNDLWRYSPSTNQWTWLAGGNADNTAGHYGTQGTAAAANVPGARQAASAWSDSSGTLWLLGGYGYDSIGQLGYLNDLWQYSPSSGLWIWISGYSGTNAVGVYGTQGTPAAANVPGARQAANTWIDSAGEVWLFGGYGCDSAGDVGALNDLWHYSPSTKEWTSVSGATLDNAPGNYGTQGTASASSAAPGARQAASSWIDSAGNLWLFGGAGFGSTGNGYLNDLWQFEPPS